MVSVLGLGSSQFRYGTAEKCAELIEQAFSLGINYYDTAISYKNGEAPIAQLNPEVREKLIITTKTGFRGGKNCLLDLQKSLNEMGRKWIDVWMTHMIQTEEEYELCTQVGGFCDIAYAAKKAGLINAYGASFHAPIGVIERAIKEKAFEVIMLQMNLIERETVFGSSTVAHRDKIIPLAVENNIGIVAMKVLAGGEMQHGATKLRELDFVRNQVDEIDASIKFVAMNPDISTSVVGVLNTEQLVKNMLSVRNISNNQVKEFNTWKEQFQNFNKTTCSRCGLCQQFCPKEIEIPKIIRLYDQNRLYGMDRVSIAKYNELKYNLLDCDNCNECSSNCPEKVNIPATLNLAHKLLGVSYL